MDTNANALEQAVAVLRERFGGQLKGPMSGTQANMRRALEEQMGVNELDADRLVKKLIETGRIAFGQTNTEAGPDTPTATGPVMSLPNTSQAQGAGPVLVPAAPALALGELNNPMGGMGGPVTGLAAAASIVGGSADVSSETDSYGRPASSETAGRSAAENRSGATMGNLADTSVEDDNPSGRSAGEAQDADDDKTDGVWRIG